MLDIEKRGHFGELDGLRGLAAITVAIEHLSNAHMPVAPGLFLGGQSRIAVWVFFALSAFLLTHQAVNVRQGDRAEWSLKYLLRRVFRIYPLFIACLFIDVSLNRVPTWAAIDYLTLTTHPSLEYIYWSIPPEFLFYFLIPIIGFAARVTPVVSVATLFAFAITSIVLGKHYDFFGFLSTFVFGSIAAISFAAWPDRIKGVARWWPIAPIIALLSSFPLVSATGLNISPVQWNGMHGALWSIVILACVYGSTALRWLSGRSLRKLGSLSFSIYLTHPWIVALAGHLGMANTWWAGAVMLAPIIGFAALTNFLVETPGERFGYWVQSRIFRKGATTAPART
ncbi:MAG: acyltransferase [Rhizobiales bacterium]|nr:acyltransferase [Hyphomicrobiales bacterium]